MLSKKYACVNQVHCVACGACIKECPKKLITIKKGCYASLDIKSCIGCGKCSRICPANAIAVVMREVE